MHTHSLNSVLLVSLSFSLSLSSLSMLFALMDSMWFRWVCSNVGVVCSDRCIMGQVVDRHGGPWVMGFGFGLIWAFFWVFSGLIMWLLRFLGIFWVDQCIMGQAPINVASTFFWVDHRHFFGYFLG